MKKRIRYLLQKYTSGQVNEVEKEELLNLTDSNPELVASEISEMLINTEASLKMAEFSNAEQVLDKILAVDKPIETKKRKLIPFLRWTAAAIVVFGISLLLYLSESGQSTFSDYDTDVSAGGNKAFLQLSDGRKVSLTDIKNGDVASQAGVTVVKTSDGQLVYNISNNKDKAISNQLNTIETPRGGMWQVKLPDGTSVWLNAESSLTYPITFVPNSPRIVKLKGEAYFEVAKDKTSPFLVRTEDQEIEVLGTHFNVNSYANEMVTKTTLLEGSVKVKANNNVDALVLKPGQQAALFSNGTLNISSVDTEESIAWKNGHFIFNHEKLNSIMRKISRWYDVEVEYADVRAGDLVYYGVMDRFDNVSRMLRKFEQTGEVKFKITDHKIIVYKVNK